MPFFDKSPLAYPANSFTPIRRYFDDRSPTIADYKQFQVGDEWLDTALNEWWKLNYRDATQGIWSHMTNATTGVETITGDDAVIVSGDAGGNLNLVGGNNITTSGNAVTFTETISLTGTTDHAIQIGNATGSLTSIAVGTDGQIPIGATGADPAFATLTSTDGTVTFTPGANTLDLSASGANVAQDQIYYVGKHGNDGNTGLNIEQAFLTFGAANAAALALVPSAVNRFVLKCFDEGIYTEDITCNAFVDIEASNATLTGVITCSDDSDVKFHALNVATGTIGVVKTAGAGTSRVDIDVVTCDGTGIGFATISGILMCKWKTLTVVDGFGIGDITSATGHMHLSGGDIYITGTGTGIARALAGSTVGHVDHILDTGAGTTFAIQVFDGTIDINVNKIDCDNAYNVSGATSILRLFCNESIGTRTIALGGTAYFLTPPLYGNAGEVWTSSGEGVDPTWQPAGGGGVNQDQIYYVGKHGNDGNTGLNIEQAFLTFGAAITAATAMFPAVNNRFTIKCFDAGLYIETITCVSYVDIEASNAELLGNIVCVDNSDVKFNIIDAPNGTIGVLKNSGTVTSRVDINIVKCTGSAKGFVATSGILFCKWKTMLVVTGFGIGDLTSNISHMHLEGGDIFLSSNATAIAINSAGSIIGNVNHIIDNGGGTTFAIQMLNGTIDINVNKIDCDNAYNVSGATSILRLFCNESIGTRTIALGGTAYFLTPPLYGNAGEVWTSNGEGVDPTFQPVGGGGITWQNIGASQALVVNNGYNCTGGAALSLSLPAASAVGDVIEVVLDGSTSWTITQGANQQIRLGSTTTTLGVGGSLASTAQGDWIRIVCKTADLVWTCVGSIGNITVV